MPWPFGLSGQELRAAGPGSLSTLGAFGRGPAGKADLGAYKCFQWSTNLISLSVKQRLLWQYVLQILSRKAPSQSHFCAFAYERDGGGLYGRNLLNFV